LLATWSISTVNFADIVELGKSLTKKGVVLWQGVTRLSDDEGDVEPLGEGEVFQGLGISSMPYPADKNGKAEAVALRGVGGRDTTYVGARDTRSAAIVGNLKPGDTVVHSTGPQQAAQVQCKEDKRRVLMASKNGAGKTIIVMLDGERDTFEVVLGGMILQLDAKQKSFCVTNGQASIIMQGGTIALDGDVILGGKIGDPVMKVVVSPAVTAVPIPCSTGATGVPGIPVAAAKSVSVATG
jgi:hypothetical protein